MVFHGYCHLAYIEPLHEWRRDIYRISSISGTQVRCDCYISFVLRDYLYWQGGQRRTTSIVYKGVSLL